MLQVWKKNYVPPNILNKGRDFLWKAEAEYPCKNTKINPPDLKLNPQSILYEETVMYQTLPLFDGKSSYLEIFWN